VYYRRAKFSEAGQALRSAFDADAYLTEIRAVVSLLFFTSLHEERFEEARSWCTLGIARYAEDPRFTECQLTLLGWTGRGRRQVTEAWEHVSAIESRDSLGMLAVNWAYRRFMVAAVLARTGMRDCARALVHSTTAELPKHRGSSDAPLVQAYVFVLLGDRSAALDLLEKHAESVPGGQRYVARTPWYRTLRGDSTFEALTRNYK
jgi:hypothetical protein